MNRLAGSVVAAALILATGGNNATAAEASTPATAATTIAHRLLTGTPDDATAAMSEAFAWAGISTVDAKRVTVTKAIAPTIPITMKSFEISKAAIAARREPTVTLESLAQLLVDLGAFTAPELETGGLEAAGEKMRKLMESGLPPEEMAAQMEKISAESGKASAGIATGITNALTQGFDPKDTGLVFVDLLGRMLRDSKEAPKNPHAFVPLLLEALAKERATRDGRAAVDLRSGNALPEDVGLTLTEAQLFLLMFRRGTTSYAAMPVRYASLGMPILPAPATPAGTKCSDLVDMMGDFKAGVPHAADFAGGSMMSTAYRLFKEYTGAEITENSQLAIGYAAKAIRLMTMLMDSSEFEVTADPTAAHYSHFDDKEVEVKFTAEVTLPSSGDSASSEAAVCLNTLFGFNIPDSPQAVAKMMADWRVYWDFDKMGQQGSVPDAKNHFKYHAPPGNKLEVSGTKGKTELIVNTAHEQDKAELRGTQRKGTMKVTASLDKSSSFDLTLIFKAGKAAHGAGAATAATGTLIFADVLADVLVEWAKKSFPPQSTASVKITWHEPKIFAWEGTITQVTRLKAVNDVTEKTLGRAPPAIAVGVSIAPPGPGVEVFHDERTEDRTLIVDVEGGHDGERIHPYTYKSKDHAKSTRKEKTPEVCTIGDGAEWNMGEWTTDFVETVDSDFSGKGFTTVEVNFQPDGTYNFQTSVPYATGWRAATGKYTGESSCTGQDDPASYPLTKIRKYERVGPFSVFGHGEAKEDAKELTGTVIEKLDDGPLGSKGTMTTTWMLKRTVVEWTGE